MRVLALTLGIVLFEPHQGVTRDLFASSVAGIGDVNQDGHADLAAVVCSWGAEYGDEHEVGPGVAAYSGLDGSLLWTGALGLHVQRFCRRSLCPVGDVDGDRLEDLALLGLRRLSCEGEIHPTSVLEIALLSGLDGSTLRSWRVGSDVFEPDEAEIACVGDVDGDSVSDLAVVAATREPRSAVWIQSCRTGEVLRWLDRDPDWWTSADWIECPGDIDGDGCADLAVLAYARNRVPTRPSEPRRTSVLVRSSQDGRRLLALERTENWSAWNCCGIGDVDGDGHPDLALAGMAWIRTPWKRGGECWWETRIHSGLDGRPLRALHGLLTEAKDGDIATPGDVDGDGVPDLLMSEIKLNPFGLGGSVRLHSGRDGSLLRESEDPPRGDGDLSEQAVSEYFGYSVRAAGDVDADDVPDWVVGQCSPWGDIGSRMVVISGRDGRAIHVIDRRSLAQSAAPR